LLPLCVAGCDEGSQTAVSQVYVLVDLSETWDRPDRTDRNHQVLQEVGYGISKASADLETPLSVQYRVIGANSLERDPLCDVLYRPTLAPIRSDADYEVNSRSHLTSYLTDSCPRYIEQQKPEPLTEIRAAIASVANQPAAGATHRTIIVISDFLEETAAPISLDSDLSGFHVILVYRPIANDGSDPAALRFRLDNWKAEIEAHGAKVDKLPDTGLRRDTVAAFITQGHSS
jgi:hypothetical protein